MTRTQLCSKLHISEVLSTLCRSHCSLWELQLLSILQNWALIALQFIKIHKRYMRLLQSLGLTYVTGALNWDMASRPEQTFKTEKKSKKCTHQPMGQSGWLNAKCQGNKFGKKITPKSQKPLYWPLLLNRAPLKQRNTFLFFSPFPTCFIV